MFLHSLSQILHQLSWILVVSSLHKGSGGVLHNSSQDTTVVSVTKMGIAVDKIFGLTILESDRAAFHDPLIVFCRLSCLLGFVNTFLPVLEVVLVNQDLVSYYYYYYLVPSIIIQIWLQ